MKKRSFYSILSLFYLSLMACLLSCSEVANQQSIQKVMKDFLSEYGPFTEEEMQAFERIGNRRRAPARTQLFQGDRPFTQLWLIESGLIRAYRIIGGEDYSYFFFSSGEFATDYQSFLTETASPLFFETLGETTYVVFDKKDIYDTYQRYPRFEKLGRLMAERAYLSAADRLKQHQTDDLKTRYLKLIQKDPELFQRVPQRHIASYLGVKPQSLSRIRAEISGKRY